MSYNHQKHCHCFHKINIIILFHFNLHFPPLHSNVLYGYGMTSRMLFQVLTIAIISSCVIVIEYTRIGCSYYNSDQSNFFVLFYGFIIVYL